MRILSRLLGREAEAPSPRPATPAGHAAPPADDAGQGLEELLGDEHARCDALWAAVEAAESEPERFLARVEAFDAATRGHLAAEEEVLFPAFEEATGMRGFGPPAIMRQEHEQMRGLLDAVLEAARAGEVDAALDLGDTLLMLTQQHNAKEEQVLYPLAADALAPRWPELRERLARFAPRPGADAG